MKVVHLQAAAGPEPAFAAALRLGGHEVEACAPDSEELPAGDAYILEGVAADAVSPRIARAIELRVEAGAGLVALGGLGAYGHGGYANTSLGRLLPVEIEDGDDRECVPSGLFLRRRMMHPLFDGMPWDQPPVVTGCHRLKPRPGSEILLEGARILSMSASNAALAAKTTPLLIVGDRGLGRVAALATDLGGTWSNGWAHWGAPSIPAHHCDSLGTAYCHFVTRLASFLGRAADAAPLDPWSAARQQPDRRRLDRAFPSMPGRVSAATPTFPALVMGVRR